MEIATFIALGLIFNTQVAFGHAITTTPEAAIRSADASQIVIDVPPPEKELTVWVTAYSSTPEETDDTPFITASGTTVRDGIVATNLLPLGTKIQMPSVFGDKIFIVEDRMHPRKVDFVDIWMPTKDKATKFGIRQAEIVVLNN